MRNKRRRKQNNIFLNAFIKKKQKKGKQQKKRKTKNNIQNNGKEKKEKQKKMFLPNAFLRNRITRRIRKIIRNRRGKAEENYFRTCFLKKHQKNNNKRPIGRIISTGKEFSS